MPNNKFVLNADDFGMSIAYNRAVLEGYQGGILKSTSITANGEAFDSAIQQVIPNCPNLGVGIHLNIIEGKSLTNGLTELTDANGNFNKSYGQLIIKAYEPKNTEFMEQLEAEFRAQIEKVKNRGIEVTHIDSHVHTHAIPPIFALVCRLAKEYEINQVRTQYEHFYTIPDVLVHINTKYPVNLIKIALLNTFTLINRPIIKKYGLKTNNFLIGVGYTSMMNNLTVSCGLAVLRHKDNINVEALIHPCRYEDGTIDGHFTEFRIMQSEKLKAKIENMGYEIVNYKEL